MFPKVCHAHLYLIGCFFVPRQFEDEGMDGRCIIDPCAADPPILRLH